MARLTEKEKLELLWFVETVQSYREGGPYGDGEDITDKKSYEMMNKIIKKLQNHD